MDGEKIVRVIFLFLFIMSSRGGNLRWLREDVKSLFREVK